MGKLERLLAKTSNKEQLKRAVIEVLINEEADKIWLEDLMSYGCISGMVGALIYYDDTHDWYDAYYDEIQELVYYFEKETGCRIMPKAGDDLKNYFAWFSFEKIAGDIYYELYDK